MVLTREARFFSKNDEEVLKSLYQNHYWEDNISNIKRTASYRNILNPVNPVVHNQAHVDLISSITQAVIQQLQKISFNNQSLKEI